MAQINISKQAMDSRKEIRRHIRQRRKQLTVNEQQQASQALKAQLTSHHQVQKATRIALYLANDGELDMQPFIDWCWQQNKEVYLPVLHPFNQGNLLFLRYQQETKLITNKYGIYEPALNVSQVCPVSNLDVLFTPLVAFDDSGARLGMGGGFYDRTLANWFDSQTNTPNEANQACQFHPIGIAHDCQQVEKVPTESWDIPLPEIITPTQNVKYTYKSKASS